MRGLVVACLLVASAAAAGDWEVEVSLGGAQGDRFLRGAPFRFRGLTFEGPYGDVAYAVEDSYSATALGGIEARRRIGRSLSLDAGVLGGLAARRQRISRGSTGQARRPSEPQELFEASLDRSNLNGRYTGAGSLAYLHAGLRYEHGFEARTTLGYRPSSARLFVEAGGGLIPLVPGGNDAGVGRPPGVHVRAGVELRRTKGRALSISLLHLRAFAHEADAVAEAHISWTGLRVGWVWGR